MSNLVAIRNKNIMQIPESQDIETFLGMPYDYRMNGLEASFYRNRKNIGNTLKIKSLIDFRFIDGTLELGGHQYHNPLQLLFIAHNAEDDQFELGTMLITLGGVKQQFGIEVDRLETQCKTAKLPYTGIAFQIELSKKPSQKNPQWKFCDADFHFEDEPNDKDYLINLQDFISDNELGFPDFSENLVYQEEVDATEADLY